MFREAFDPRGEKFFRQNGLLFLDLKDIEGLVDKLAAAQAFLGSLWVGPSSRGLFSVLRLAVANIEGTTPLGSLSQTFSKVAAAAEASNSAAVT